MCVGVLIGMLATRMRGAWNLCLYKDIPTKTKNIKLYRMNVRKSNDISKNECLSGVFQEK